MELHESESRTLLVMSKDDDYIDMELNLSSPSSSQSSSFISFSITSSPPQSREFEFQMCSSAVASGESTPSPADELFYKGQLLPLHLPPRLQMVQKLLASSSAVKLPQTSSRTAVSSPRRFSSSEIEVSGLKKQSFLEISTEVNPGNSWSKKIKHLSITQKLKASRAFIKALFLKPSDSFRINPKSKIEGVKVSKFSRKKNPFEKIEYPNSNNPKLIHRKSFSGVLQRHCPEKCFSSTSSSSSSSLSSSFSSGSNGSLDLQMVMRSSNVSSEIDNSIEEAIEHCKQSFTAKKSNVISRNLTDL